MAMLLELDGNPRCRIETADARSPNMPVDDGSPNRSNNLEGQNCHDKVIQCHNLNTTKQNDSLGVSDCSKRDKIWKGLAEKSQDNDTKVGNASARSRALQQAVSHGVRQAQLHLQNAQPQQTSVTRWERLLPQHQLRVLLVEDDDATRHVVSALLRNCSYEVTSASNGLMAWEFLMDQNSKVDLVLTEVVMPCLSGIGLLARITSHEPIKHIPVIMMSSHDSMGVVFKCLSNGAVDFLVKPVRKNELKNLWQHVWRRCQSSNGSGSGSWSGSQNQIIVQPEAAREANNSISNDESDNASIGGGSDNGSGTQSSWTRKAVEVESSLRSAPDGLMLQLKSGCIPEAVHQKGRNDVDSNVEESQVGVPELVLFPKDNTPADSKHPTQGILAETTVLGGDSRDRDVCAGDAPFVDNWQKATSVSETPAKDKKAKQEQQAESEDMDEFAEKHASNSPSSKGKMISDSSSPSLWKGSLKRPRQENDREHEVRGGLKHSCSSAFSRYQNSGNINNSAGGEIKIHPPPTPFGDHSFVQGSSVGSSHPQSIPFRSQADRTPFSKGRNDEVLAPPYYRAAFTKEDASLLAIGSGMKVHFPSPTAVFNGFGASSNEPVSDPTLPPHWGPSTEKVEVSEYHGSLSQGHHDILTNHQESHVHHHAYHHHHHHHHHVQHHRHHRQDQLQPRTQTPQQVDSTLVCGTAAPKCGSSNMGKGGEGNNGHCGSNIGYGSVGNGAVSLNGSASGSNNGSNGGQSVAAELTGVGNNMQPVGGSGVTVAQHVPLDPDQSRHAWREAALNKFRQKRKERCFEKKVRYQSRKRLAEQRPRVRGQFVRQSVK